MLCRIPNLAVSAAAESAPNYAMANEGLLLGLVAGFRVVCFSRPAICSSGSVASWSYVISAAELQLHAYLYSSCAVVQQSQQRLLQHGRFKSALLARCWLCAQQCFAFYESMLVRRLLKRGMAASWSWAAEALGCDSNTD
jgi:hypothetical protein